MHPPIFLLPSESEINSFSFSFIYPSLSLAQWSLPSMLWVKLWNWVHDRFETLNFHHVWWIIARSHLWTYIYLFLCRTMVFLWKHWNFMLHIFIGNCSMCMVDCLTIKISWLWAILWWKNNNYWIIFFDTNS